VLDVMVNKPFKDHRKQLSCEWLLAGDCASSPAGRIKKPTVTVLWQWIITLWQHSPEVTVKGFKKCCVSSKWAGLMTIRCGIIVMGMGMLGESVRNMNALIVKMERVTTIGRGRQNPTHFLN
jgi:hypothetical protein